MAEAELLAPLAEVLMPKTPIKEPQKGRGDERCCSCKGGRGVYSAMVTFYVGCWNLDTLYFSVLVNLFKLSGIEVDFRVWMLSARSFSGAFLHQRDGLDITWNLT